MASASSEASRGEPAREYEAETQLLTSGSVAPAPAEAQTQAQLRHLASRRIKYALGVMLAAVPVGLFSLAFARAWWVTLLGAVAMLSMVGGVFVMVHYATRSTHPQARERYHLVAFGIALAAGPLIYSMGTYTGFAGVIAMFVMLYAMGSRPRYAVRVTLAIAVPHLLIHLAIMVGWIADLGVISADAEGGQAMVSVFGVASIYALALVAGQVYRRRTEKVLAELRQAARQIATREAMLREARIALQEAGGIGQTGRFSDQQVGRFVLGPLLGRGGMGEIYEAREIETEAPAAVKLLRFRVIDDDTAWRRFDREAQIAASISSPHVVRVLEVGGRETGLPYIAMERLRGRDLAQLIREEPFLGRRRIAQMVVQIAEGLAAAHTLDIVHRDVKPPNLFCCNDGTWKMLDFGVARLGGGSQTLTQGLVGTPGYMAPEQVGSVGEIDHRTDIHALAVVAYRTITGRPAFHGKEVAAILRRIGTALPPEPRLGDPSPIPTEKMKQVSAAVADVLRVALAKRPEERFDDVRVFAEHLANALLDGVRSPEVTQRAARLNERLPWGTEPRR